MCFDTAQRGYELPRTPSRRSSPTKDIAPVLCRQRSTEQVRGLLPIRPLAYCALPESVATGPGLSTVLGSCRRSPLRALGSVGHGDVLEIEARRCDEAELSPGTLPDRLITLSVRVRCPFSPPPCGRGQRLSPVPRAP